MAPMFNVPSPKRSTQASKPSFLFNMRSPSTEGSFFRKPQSPSPIRGAMDGAWSDVSDSVAVQHNFDDSRALTYNPEDSMPPTPGDGTLDQYRAECSGFALRLDTTNLLENEDPRVTRTSISGFDTIENFKDYTASMVEDAREYVQSLADAPEHIRIMPDHQEKLNEATSELSHWELEHQTWDLFGALSAHRFGPPEPEPPQLVINRYTSDERIREYLIQADKGYKELSLIRAWLHHYAPNPAEKVLEAKEYQGDRGWVYTKEKIKSDKRAKLSGKMVPFGGGVFPNFGSFKKTKEVVSELDPDAPLRQKRILEEEDARCEALLMKLVWAFMRKGDLEGAKDLCADAGEWWRAATLAGGVEVYDPNLDSANDNDMMDSDRSFERVVGNKRRELWRRACWALAQNATEDYEKAVYGLLSGDMDTVIPVCTSWEDHLFAHLNSLVEGYYAAYLAERSRIPPAAASFQVFDSLPWHGLSEPTLQDRTYMPKIIASLHAAPHLKHESRLPLRVIQGALISSRFPDLVEILNRQLTLFKEVASYDPSEDESNLGLDVTDCRTLRMAAHLVLIIRSLDAGFNPGEPLFVEGENVIAAYFEALGAMNMYELIPLYAGRLSRPKAVETLGKLFINVEDEARREELLRLMHLHDLEVYGSLRKTMELALEATKDYYEDYAPPRGGFLLKNHEGAFSEELAEEDKLIISGLEWLVMGGDELRADVLRNGVEVYRRFMLTGRLLAAKTLYEKIPSRDIIPPEEDDMNSYLNGDTSMADASSPDSDPANHRHRYSNNPLLASDETRLWAAAFLEFESLIESIIALENWRVAVHVSLSSDSGKPRGSRRALEALYAQVQKSALETAKTFLAYDRFAALRDVPRIRNVYVPELVLALAKVYIEAARWVNPSLLAGAFELAVVVADPERGVLRPVRETGRLPEFVNAIAEAGRRATEFVQEKKGGEQLRIWGVAK